MAGAELVCGRQFKCLASGAVPKLSTFNLTEDFLDIHNPSQSRLLPEQDPLSKFTFDLTFQF